MIKEREFMRGYLIGIRYSDGCVYFENFAKRFIFELQAIDKEMVDYTSKCLNVLFGRKTTVRECSRLTVSDNSVWRVRTPVDKIKDHLDLDLLTTKNSKIGFVSAFYDAEGTLSNNSVSISSTDLVLLNFVNSILDEVSQGIIVGTIDKFRENHPKWKDCYRMYLKKGRIKGNKRNRIFFDLFSPQIKRKISKINNK